MCLWPAVILGFPILNWVVRTQPEGNESIVFIVSNLTFYVVWSIWYASYYISILSGLTSLCFSGFSWVCIGSLVNDASPSAEALSLITGTSACVTLRFWCLPDDRCISNEHNPPTSDRPSTRKFPVCGINLSKHPRWQPHLGDTASNM
jgi:hypothetical protein